MTIQVGDRLPDVPLAIAGAEGPQPTTSSEFFKGKRVALFAVPGAYTPTCSARHLPSFVDKAQELKDQGIDEIACVSVNDPFVMAAWGTSDGSDDITFRNTSIRTLFVRNTNGFNLIGGDVGGTCNGTSGTVGSTSSSATRSGGSARPTTRPP